MEIQTPDFAWGLSGVLQERADDLHGILNGIDVEVWNPSRDPLLGAPYTAEDLAPRRVHEHRAGLHQPELARPDHPARLRRRRHVKADEIGPLQKIVDG